MSKELPDEQQTHSGGGACADLLGGLLAGLFGVGGGFLLTPLLIFIGIPPAIAVASSANQMIASSLSGFLSHWRRGNVDFRIGTLLLIGGLIGSSLGVSLFSALSKLGQIDLVIALCYVLFLGSIGGIMASESIRTIRRKNLGDAAPAPEGDVKGLGVGGEQRHVGEGLLGQIDELAVRLSTITIDKGVQ